MAATPLSHRQMAMATRAPNRMNGPVGHVVGAFGTAEHQKEDREQPSGQETRDRTSQQRAPPEPAKRGADAGSQFPVFSELKMISISEAPALSLTERD